MTSLQHSVRPATAIAALCLGLAAAPVAQAQLARNSKAPVDITADQLELVNSQCSAVYSGGAEALQETSRLRANELRIIYAPAPPGSGKNGCSSDLLRMEATGSVFYVTPEQRVRGDKAVYDAKTQTLTVTGSVAASRGQDVMKGERLVVNTVSGDARMEGGGERSGRRVRTVIYPGASPDAPK